MHHPLVERLRALVASRDDIELAIAFGSLASGRLRVDSDIDLAISWRGPTRPDITSWLAAVERELARPIDLVDPRDAPPQLRFEIARSGIPIVEAHPGAWAQFRARAMLDWWDFAPIARAIHRAALERLRETVHGPG